MYFRSKVPHKTWQVWFSSLNLMTMVTNRIDKESPSLEDLNVLLDGSEGLRWARVETLEIKPAAVIALVSG